MSVHYQMVEYDDFDIEAVVRIALAIRPDALDSAAEYREIYEAQRRAGRVSIRWLASIDGRLIGSAMVGQTSRMPSEIMAVYVAVHPDHQQRGYGRELLTRAEASATERRGKQVYSWTDETQPRSIAFLDAAGYREVDRGWESTLDLAACDPDRLQRAVDDVAAGGITIESVATIASFRSDWKEALHRLYVDVEGDVPAPIPIREVAFEDFETLNLGDRLVADGFLIGLDGTRLVGLTETHQIDDAPNEIAQSLTGVRYDYRGRGIATALKSQAALWAIDNGYRSIRTHNAQSNQAMLAINQRMGFQRGHATMTYLKAL